jgi:hypothetical protein
MTITGIRNFSFLVLLFTILYAGPVWADPCGGGWGSGFCDCGTCGTDCHDVYCDYSPYTCAEANPGFCGNLSSLSYDYCGPDNYQ